jgi:hypothetical protein
MSNLAARKDAIYAITPNETHAGKEGYAVVASGTAAAPTASLVTSATATLPLGVILDGQPTTGRSSIAMAGGDVGPVYVKLDATPGAVVQGSYLVITATGTFKLDAGSGGRIQMARAMEAGSADELIEAILLPPVSLS